MTNTALPRVEIDLNSRDEHGLTRVALRYADGALQPGQEVVAFQDGTAWLAIVERLNAKFAHLAVKWESYVDDSPEAHQPPSDVAKILMLPVRPQTVATPRARPWRVVPAASVAAGVLMVTMTPGNALPLRPEPRPTLQILNEHAGIA